MNITRDKKKEEAVRRMQMMGVREDVITLFNEDNEVSMSEPPFGTFCPLDEEVQKMVKELEEKYNIMVYMVVRSFTTIGKMDALLFVGDEVSEWYMDIEDLESESAYAYVINHDMPVFSEFGQIGWKLTQAGGLVRTM